MGEDQSTTRNLVTMVCTGNICRSPMAMALLRHALEAEEEPLKSLEVTSAGLAAIGGDPVSENSVRALKSVGLEIDNHVSQPLTEDLARRSVALFCMTSSHKMMVDMAYPGLHERIFLLREFMGEGEPKEIPDPYGSSLKEYENTRDNIVEAIPSIVGYLRRNRETLAGS